MEEDSVSVVVGLIAIVVVWILVRVGSWLLFRRTASSLGLSRYGAGVASFSEINSVPLLGGAWLKRHAYVSPSQEGFYVLYQNIGGPMSRSVSVYQTPFSGADMGAIVGELQGGTPLPPPYQGKLHGGLHLFGGTGSVLSALAEDRLLQMWASGSQLSFQTHGGMLYVFARGSFAWGRRLAPFAESSRMLAQHVIEKYGHNNSLKGTP